MKEAIRAVFHEELKNRNYNDLSIFAHENHDILQLLYEHEIISDKDFDSVLEDLVLKEASRNYHDCLNKKVYFSFDTKTRELPGFKRYPDDPLCNQDCLAYAFKKNFFSKSQLNKLSFDHGETLEDFIKMNYNPNLLKELRENMLNPPKISNSDSSEECFESHDP